MLLFRNAAGKTVVPRCRDTMNRSVRYTLLLALFVGACGSDEENGFSEPILGFLQMSFASDKFVSPFESLPSP